MEDEIGDLNVKIEVPFALDLEDERLNSDDVIQKNYKSRCDMLGGEETLNGQDYKKQDGNEELKVMKNEVIENYNVGNHICVDCGGEFANEDSLLEHMHSCQFELKDNLCNNFSNTEENIAGQNASNIDVQFKCDESECSLMKSSVLPNHLKTTQKTEKYFNINTEHRPFKCSECHFASKTRGNLSSHINAVHYKERPFQCDECDYNSSTKSILLTHIKAVHKKEKPFKCSGCEYSSFKKSHTLHHIRAVHTKEKPFKCLECDYSSVTKSLLSDHVKTVHKKENFKCGQCDFSSLKKYVVARHTKDAHYRVKTFKCSQCDYSGFTENSIITHIKATHITNVRVKRLYNGTNFRPILPAPTRHDSNI